MELAIPLFLGPTPNDERKVFGFVGGHSDGDYCWGITRTLRWTRTSRCGPAIAFSHQKINRTRFPLAGRAGRAAAVARRGGQNKPFLLVALISLLEQIDAIINTDQL